MADSVLILGARGSVPVSGRQFTKYGGATSSYLVTLCGKTVVLDGGTGLLNLPKAVLSAPELDLILSHPHADHLLGVGMLGYTGRLRIYSKTRGGLSPREQVERFYSPPLWPVSPEAEYLELGEKTVLGAITVETAEGIHPGGVSLIKLSGGGKTVVYATDTTLARRICGGLRSSPLRRAVHRFGVGGAQKLRAQHLGGGGRGRAFSGREKAQDNPPRPDED